LPSIVAVQVRRVLLGASLGLLVFVLSAQVVGAVQAPLPPPAVVVEVVDLAFTPPQGTYQSNVTVAIHVSPDDPDQVNGSYKYNLWLNETAVAGCSTAASGWLKVGNGDVHASGRAGWVFPGGAGSNVSFAGFPLCGVQNVFALNVTANNTAAGLSSEPSCQVNLSLNHFGAHDQCGVPVLNASLGVTARVNATATVNGGSNDIPVRWLVSSDDANLTVGNLSYRLLVNGTGGAGLATLFNGSDPRDADDAGGVRGYFFQAFGTAPFEATFTVRVEDPVTRQWSNWSCSSSVNVRNIYEENGCGVFAASAVPSFGTAPQFPLLDVPAFATAMNLPLDAAGWFLSGVLLLVLVLAGFQVAGGVGALIAGILGLAAAAFMSLIPLWIIVLIFMGAVIVIVVMGKSGGSSA